MLPSPLPELNPNAFRLLRMNFLSCFHFSVYCGVNISIVERKDINTYYEESSSTSNGIIKISDIIKLHTIV